MRPFGCNTVPCTVHTAYWNVYAAAETGIHIGRSDNEARSNKSRKDDEVASIRSMNGGDAIVLQLRRPTSDKSWGFMLQGGVDQGLPVFVHKLTRNGIAHKSGVEPGDVILKICETPVHGMTHAQVKAEILRAGNDLDFTLRKREFNVAAYNAAMNQNRPVMAPNSPTGGEARAEIVEEHLWKHGGPTYKNVTPKSYKILEQQLPQSESGGAQVGSIFDKSRDERSSYIQAHEKTIQKAFGET
ncbi:Synaptopodin 2-like [Cichlidogyrus casuarinus]|uniref:Synaptopodin 2-like n=1 Tax=Cichlidogyrus casuarinus TaxID=1844966 RepID=A0ABD2Q653_9PLAT